MRLALANSGESQIDARVDVEPETMKLNADPELLAQAILNLLRNAIRATAEVEAPMICLSIRRQPGGRFRIEIRDNGPGIPEDRREDIFLPFYTTHRGGSSRRPPVRELRLLHARLGVPVAPASPPTRCPPPARYRAELRGRGARDRKG